MTIKQKGTWAVVAAVMLLTARAHATGDADSCEAAKNKLAGKYAFCREKAEAKAIKTGSAPDYSKCDAKIDLKWMATEANGGGMCPTAGDEMALRSCITADTNVWAAVLSGSGVCAPPSGLPRTGQTQCDQGAGDLGACPGDPPGQDAAVMAGLARSFTDNGDGTLTDNVTGLMWEKLSDDDGIHDLDNAYTWSDAFAVKIAALNSGPGFAGHTDWRLPNEFELETLVDLERPDLAIASAFDIACIAGCGDTTCSCTQNDFHWSSTSYQQLPARAWRVDFYDATVTAADKSSSHYVRAVRDGS